MLDRFLNHELAICVEKYDDLYLGYLQELIPAAFPSGAKLDGNWFKHLIQNSNIVYVVCHYGDTLYWADVTDLPTVSVNGFIEAERSSVVTKIQEKEFKALFGE